MAKQICIVFRLSHNSKTNLCSSIYHIAVLIALQRQPPRNLQIIICIERAFTACSLAMLPAYAPVDPACETFSACRKIKVVQRELSAAQCPGPEGGVRSRAGSADLTGGFKCLYLLYHYGVSAKAPTTSVVCTICGPTVVPPPPEASNRLPTRSTETYPVSH